MQIIQPRVIGPPSPAAQFWSRVDRGHPDDCWECKWAPVSSGYCLVPWKGKNRYAHRVALEVSGGTLIDGLVVMHSCDNRRCCNPAHLRQATQRDNIQDSIRKGRFHQHRRGRIPAYPWRVQMEATFSVGPNSLFRIQSNPKGTPKSGTVELEITSASLANGKTADLEEIQLSKPLARAIASALMGAAAEL